MLLPARALAIGALASGCPQQLTDDFSIERVDAAPAPTAADCAPFEACGAACVDLQSNPAHCGACGAAVEDREICSQGTGVDAESGCGARRLCERGCVDVQSHALHCGACGVRCDRDARCMLGRCECPPGTRDCGSSCRECCSSSDCPMQKTCSAGECVLVCSFPTVACMDRCVDLQEDPMHCGRCRNACGPMGVCTKGTCAPP